MRLPLVLKSIRGKLILVFLLAVAPVLCIQISHQVSQYLAAECEYLRHEADLAAVSSRAVGRFVSRIKAHQDRRAAQFVKIGQRQVLARAINSEIEIPFFEGIRTVFEYVENGPPLLRGHAGKSVIVDNWPDKQPDQAFFIVTPLHLVRGQMARLVTYCSSAALLSRIPSGANAREWDICALLDGYGNPLVSTKRTGADISVESLVTILSSSIRTEADTHMTSAGGMQWLCASEMVPGTNWRAVIVGSSERVLALHQNYMTWTAAYTIATIFGLALLYAMGVRLTRPIRRMVHAANAIALGDYRKRVDVRSRDELEALAKALNSLGQSLQNHESIMKGQAEMLAGMVEAARVASSSLDVKECGMAIARVACTHLGASDAVVFRVNTGANMKIIGRCGGKYRRAWRRLAQHAADSGGYLVISEHQGENELDGATIHSFLAGIPLISGSGSIGAIVARFQGNITRSDLWLGSLKADVLTAFGVHAAAAINNAETYARTEEYSEILEDWVEHLSSVMQVTNAISPSLNLDETLACLAEATASVMSVGICFIFLPDRTGNLRVRSSSKPNTLVDSLIISPGQGITGKAYVEQRYVACCDTMNSLNASFRNFFDISGLRGVLSAPLIVEGRAIGAITVYNNEPHEFSAQEVRLLTSIALHAAVIVRNASLYTREASIAETLQRGLVSQVPEICAGFEFAGRYMPALDEAKVGGDFYDVAELPNGKVGILMGDVSGKGLNAAIHLATCKYMLKALKFAYPDNPAQVLGELNRALNHYFNLEFFVTVFYGIIDPADGSIVYSNAGHPPALLISEGEKILTQLGSTGTPAGAGQDCIYEIGRAVLGAADILLLYTDGLIDFGKEGTAVGIDGIQGILYHTGPCSASQLLERICGELYAEPNSLQNDDVALLALRFAKSGRTESTGGSYEQHQLTFCRS